jgi:hypothetical protein
MCQKLLTFKFNIMDNVDIQTVEVTSFDKEHIEMELKAKEVAQTLTNAYPNYPWVVGWHPGFVLCVKLLINPDYNYGYTIDAAKDFTPGMLAQAAKMAGGELLERLGLRRGAWNGDMPEKNIEGVDKSHAVPIFR